MPDERFCVLCGKPITSSDKRKKVCDDVHYSQCMECDKDVLIVKPSRVPKFCGTDCSKKHNGKHEGKYILNCELCGKEFNAVRETVKFCSDTHYRDCVVCGTKFKISNNHKPAVTCSKKCAMGVADIEVRTKKTRETNLERYGVENVSQLDAVKKKKVETLLVNYGVTNPSLSDEIKKKRVDTFVDRFGYDNPYKNPDVKRKVAETNLKKYGVENVFMSNDFQKKASETIFQKYGVSNIFQLPEVKEKAIKSNKKTISKTNVRWHDKLLKQFDIDFKYEVPFGNYYADLGYGTLLIDINPSVTHNSSYAFAHFFNYCKVDNCTKHKPTDEYYHQKRALAALDNGFTLLQFFDWMDEDIFFSMVRSKLGKDEYKVPARKTTVKVVKQSEANKFFAENHLNGGSNKQTVCVGLFHDDVLVHVNSYGPSRFNKGFQWEAIRSCSKMNYHVQGGFSRCEKFFMENYQPNSIVSYVDLSVSAGSTDVLLDGWQKVRVNRPSATWVNLLNNGNPPFVRDGTARRVSADRLLGFEVGEKYPLLFPDGSKVDNDFVLLSEGYVKMFDAGTVTFGYRS